MRLVITAMVGLLLGGVIGRLGPASDLASLEAELAEARASADCETQSLGRDLAALMGSGLDTPQRRAPPEPPVDLDAGEAEAEAMREEMTGGLRREFGDDTELQVARTALALRKSQARAALVQDADPSDDQLADIDAAVDDMNASLEVLAQDLVDMFEEGGEPGRRDAMVFAAEALDTMIVTEDRIWDSLDDDQRDAVDDGAVDPFSYVDETIVDVLSALGETP
jgi:hypothetical protein